MDEARIKALYIELLKAMLDNINQASTERAHNHIKLSFALGELTGLRSQRLEILPRWQTLALACWKALPKVVGFNEQDYGDFVHPDDIPWAQVQEVLRDFLGMFTAGNIH